MMQFKYQFDEGSESVIIEMSPESTLTEAIDAFSRFLKAAGYRFDGEVTIVEEGENNESTPDQD